jgi:hypothetical protein
MRVRALNGWLLRARRAEALSIAPPLSSESSRKSDDDMGGTDSASSSQDSNRNTPQSTMSVSLDGDISDDEERTEPARRSSCRVSGPILAGNRQTKAEGRAEQNSRPPRFPSETKIDDAKDILGLSPALYRALRITFKRLCEESEVAKKTLAGLERWEAMKQQLLREIPALQQIMTNSQMDSKSKKLALDVICTDITKRMRITGKSMTVKEARNVLGINPEQSQDIRTTFSLILIESHFTSLADAGRELWEDVKKRWVNGSQTLQRALGPELSDAEREKKLLALDTIAREISKRLRSSSSQTDPNKEPVAAKAELAPAPSPEGNHSPSNPQADQHTRPTVPAPVPTPIPMPVPTPVLTPVLDRLDVVDHMSNSHYDDIPTNTQMPMSVLEPLPPQNGRSQDAAVALAQSPVRLLSPPVLHHTTGLTLTLQLDPSMLATGDTPTSFVDQQFDQQYAAAPAFPPVHPTSFSAAAYFQSHPSSTFTPPRSMWIGALRSFSFQDLQQTATAKFPGVICVRVEGIIKDEKGPEMPLLIERDEQLETFLTHLEGVSPTFIVQLVAA